MIYSPATQNKNKQYANQNQEQSQNNAAAQTSQKQSNINMGPPRANQTQQGAAGYVPGQNINAMTGLANAQKRIKIRNFAEAAKNNAAARSNVTPINAAANLKTPSVERDYAAEILQLYQQPPTAENRAKVAELMHLRNWKTSQYPEAYGQYKNDDFGREAENYANKVSPSTVDITGYVKSMADNNEQRYEAYKQLLEEQRQAQATEIQKKYEDLRKAQMLSAARNAMGTEEMLAAQGLGRGVSNAASSGLGETSRMMAQASLNNNLANSYIAEQSALAELQRQQNQNNLQAFIDYANRATGIDEIGVTQANADREHDFNAQLQNAQLGSGDKDYDLQERSLDQSELMNAQSIKESDFNMGETKRMNDQSITESDFNMGETKRMNDQSITESNFNIGETRRMNDETIRNNKENNSIDWYNASKKKSSGSSSSSGGSYGYGYNPDQGNTPDTADTPAANAYTITLQALTSGGKNAAIQTLAALSANGYADAIEVQNIVDQLGLTQSDGWLK